MSPCLFTQHYRREVRQSLYGLHFAYSAEGALGRLAVGIRPQRGSPSPLRMAVEGHQDAFLRPKLSARCRFSQRTFARTRDNGRDAPIPVIRWTSRSDWGRPFAVIP